MAGQGDASYIFNGALAQHLKDARGWDEKVLLLITVMEKRHPKMRRASSCCRRSMPSWPKFSMALRRCTN
jgi:hypothetical protein